MNNLRTAQGIVVFIMSVMLFGIYSSMKDTGWLAVIVPITTLIVVILAVGYAMKRRAAIEGRGTTDAPDDLDETDRRRSEKYALAQRQVERGNFSGAARTYSILGEYELAEECLAAEDPDEPVEED